jgi:hypothetical protein
VASECQVSGQGVAMEWPEGPSESRKVLVSAQWAPGETPGLGTICQAQEPLIS